MNPTITVISLYTLVIELWLIEYNNMLVLIPNMAFILHIYYDMDINILTDLMPNPKICVVHFRAL